MNPLISCLERMPRPLSWAAAAHAALALACLAALLLPSAPVGGVHPALKPLKFAISISLFLAAMGVLLPALSASPRVRGALAWILATTMAVEMLLILAQALRGTTSHFNQHGSLNNAIWKLMALAIVIATLCLVCVTLLSSIRPLHDETGRRMAPLLAFAWRAGLWLLLLAPVSGFAMASSLQHSVGGLDVGAGLPFVNWSVVHGDLRVAHFFALHALQLLPILAWGLLRWTSSTSIRWGLLLAVLLASTALCAGTLVQAFKGRPFMTGCSGRGLSASPPRDHS
jgi:hypothetical protein